MLIEVPHPTIGPLKLAGSPLKFGAAEPMPLGAPPRLGEHTDAVLEGILGLSNAEIEHLRASGVV
jgi:succinate---hydroxymethylglutarate CoA-transferase